MNEGPTANRALRAWVQAIAEHTRPARIRWCNGSAEERTTLRARLRDAYERLAAPRVVAAREGST